MKKTTPDLAGPTGVRLRATSRESEENSRAAVITSPRCWRDKGEEEPSREQYCSEACSPSLADAACARRGFGIPRGNKQREDSEGDAVEERRVVETWNARRSWAEATMKPEPSRRCRLPEVAGDRRSAIAEARCSLGQGPGSETWSRCSRTRTGPPTAEQTKAERERRPKAKPACQCARGVLPVIRIGWRGKRSRATPRGRYDAPCP